VVVEQILVTQDTQTQVMQVVVVQQLVEAQEHLVMHQLIQVADQEEHQIQILEVEMVVQV